MQQYDSRLKTETVYNFIDNLQNRDGCCAWNGPSDYYMNRILNPNQTNSYDCKYFILRFILMN